MNVGTYAQPSHGWFFLRNEIVHWNESAFLTFLRISCQNIRESKWLLKNKEILSLELAELAPEGVKINPKIHLMEKIQSTG